MSDLLQTISVQVQMLETGRIVQPGDTGQTVASQIQATQPWKQTVFQGDGTINVTTFDAQYFDRHLLQCFHQYLQTCMSNVISIHVKLRKLIELFKKGAIAFTPADPMAFSERSIQGKL